MATCGELADGLSGKWAFGPTGHLDCWGFSLTGHWNNGQPLIQVESHFADLNYCVQMASKIAPHRLM